MAGQTTSSRALIYFSERVEDAAEAVKGLIGGSGSSKYLDTSDEKTSVIRSQLESDRDDLRLEGLRTIIALISKGRDASLYFPSVLKLTSNANLEIRKLVYIIVRRYAKRLPDVALLGINSFQRDLLDRSEVVRAMALRVLSGLRLALVASVVEVAIAKCVKDASFFVRKGAALAIIKCHALSSETRPALKVHLATLFNDRHPAVLSTSLVAYAAICPLDFALLHAHYRKLCHALSDMDEWGQRTAIEVLGMYAKHCFAAPSSSEKLDPDLELLLSKVEDLLMSRNAAVVTAAIRLIYYLAPPSRHAVIARPLVRLVASPPDISYFALVNCYLLAQTSPSLLSPHLAAFFLRSSMQEPSHVSCLKLKILVRLTDASSSEMVLSELSEQARFHSSEPVAKMAVEQLGVLAGRGTINAQPCTKELLKLLQQCSDRDEVVGKAVSVLRRLIESCPSRDRGVIVFRLAALLFSPPAKKGSTKKTKLVGKAAVKSGMARGCIYWLLGQHCRLEVQVKEKGVTSEKTQSLAEVIGADVLRRAAINFSREEPYAKLQIITLSTKLNTFLPTTGFEHSKTIGLLQAYILQLARYDEDFDVRDRGRFCKALTNRVDGAISTVPHTESEREGESVKGEDKDSEEMERLGGVVLRRNQVLHILFEGKQAVPNASETGRSTNGPERTLDTLAFVLRGGGKGRSLSMVRDMDFTQVDWAPKEKLPPASVREPAERANLGPALAPSLPHSDSQHSISTQAIRDASFNGNVDTTSSQEVASGAPSAAKYKDLDAFLDAQSDDQGSEGDDDDDDEEEEGDNDDDEEDEEEEEEEDDEGEGDSVSTSSDDTDENTGKGTESSRLIAPVEENEWAR